MKNAILIFMIVGSHVGLAEIMHPKSMNPHEKNETVEIFDDLNARFILSGSYDLAIEEKRNFVGEAIKIGNISCFKYSNFPVLSGGPVLIIEYYPELNFYRWSRASVEEAVKEKLIWNYVNFFDSSERELLPRSYIMELEQLTNKAQNKLEEYNKRVGVENIDPFE